MKDLEVWDKLSLFNMLYNNVDIKEMAEVKKFDAHLETLIIIVPCFTGQNDIIDNRAKATEEVCSSFVLFCLSFVHFPGAGSKQFDCEME